ncbi:hypothetical protein Clacol_002021 [Clathrus columnatus]|uniref:Phosphoribosylaminoimidazole carboxylase n=1 Tax=Clathrus columnatus TaxID=1419009 RepID=A0AAV4ZZL7_9AGAM|nr:hypothetical protein Clacol_002021 [Clathrus columnatus]
MKRVGVLGGGQLGRMLAASASLLNIPVSVLEVGEHAPAKQVISPVPPLKHVDGSFTSPSSIRQLAAQVDILTVEIEHVNVSVLEDVQKETGIEVHPSPRTIRIIQDKFIQKEHLKAHGLSVANFLPLEPTIENVRKVAAEFGLPLMIKSRTLAYDGRGNYVLRSLDDASISAALTALANRPLYAEQWVPFIKEAAVVVVRSISGEVYAYPLVETVHKDNICHLVFAPYRGSVDISSVAQRIAEDAVRTFNGAGVFGVELFVREAGDVYINEIAPRPHNSGHYTIEACNTSQYENHLRAILDLPIGNTSLIVPSAIMLNLIGTSDDQAPLHSVIATAFTIPGACVHLYGKSQCRKGRKMGHITIVATDDAEARSRLRPLLAALPSSDTTKEVSLYTPLPSTSGHSHLFPLVSIIMGSDSDLPVMRAAAEVLSALSVPFELTIVSAHRTPDRMVQFAKSARGRGIRVIIAGAGGAAHLPGMVAALTTLPVIGVPVKGSTLDGVDSLHSIVQMPRGIPVATVAINNALNGGLLAARILGTGIPEIGDRVEAYMLQQKCEVERKIDNLMTQGWERYNV